MENYYTGEFIDVNATNLILSTASLNGLSTTEHTTPTTVVKTLILILLPCLSIASIYGNVAVIYVIFKVAKLRAKTEHLLLVSLAISDMLVGAIVMPLSIAYEVLGKWPLVLGMNVCSMWVTFDVLSCTASILNLMMIAIDRYLIITRTCEYQPRRTTRLMMVYIAIAWGVSIFISITPLIVGWNVIYEDGLCTINQDIGYQLYATLVAFYLPLFVMMALYTKVYFISTQAAQVDAARRPNTYTTVEGEDTSHEATDTTLVSYPLSVSSTVDTQLSSIEVKTNGVVNGKNNSQEVDDSVTCKLFTNGHPAYDGKEINNNKLSPAILKRVKLEERRRSSDLPTRRRKDGGKNAIQTLGVIMGLFIFCWMPFFILALVRSLCNRCQIPSQVTSVLTWLGYLNSSVNPLVYARFNKDFRIPMKKIITCQWRQVVRSVRIDDYKSRYGP